MAFAVDDIDEAGLQRAMDFCLSDEGRRRAEASAALARGRLVSARAEFLRALAEGDLAAP
jgi:hypothetical protein